MYEILVRNKEGFLSGLGVTVQICLFAWAIGLVLGTLLGYLISKNRVVSGVTEVLSYVVSSIPVLVFLFWLHYPAQRLLDVSVDPLITTIFLLSLLNLLAVADIIKTGVHNVPKQYAEVGLLCGLSKRRIFRAIQLPLIGRHVLPPLLMAQVNVLHMSLFASLISVPEIFRVSQRIVALELRPVEIYSALGLLFLVVSLPMIGMATMLKRRFKKTLDER